MVDRIKVLWKSKETKGEIITKRAKLDSIEMLGRGIVSDNGFDLSGKYDGIIITISNITGGIGTNPALITLNCNTGSFTFRIMDVTVKQPIYIREYGVVVIPAADNRDYNEIIKTIEGRNPLSPAERIEAMPEESYKNACENTNNTPCPVWLGIGRDIHLFEVGFRGGSETWDYIKPKYHFIPKTLENENKSVLQYGYIAGRGIGCEKKLIRSLEDGYLPIVNCSFVDGDIDYSYKIFVTLEESELKEDNLQGTHYLVADASGFGSTLNDEQQKRKQEIWEQEIYNTEQTVLYISITAENKTADPKYAWVRVPQPSLMPIPDLAEIKGTYDSTTGFGALPDGGIFVIATMNNMPVEQVETAVLIQPSACVKYQFIIPHSPVSRDRAVKLSKQDGHQRYIECKKFWQNKLSKGMQVSLPEKHIENRIKAGFTHLDIVTYGKEKNAPLAPMAGVYCPIGSESSPMIQFYNSFGRSDIARRCLDYFYDKQHDDGFMQNYGGYMLENGAVLWTTFLHYLYTNDISYIKSREINIIKACDYLINWINRNKTNEMIGRGFGMLDGRVADPEDPYHAYMLNAYGYAGLYGASLILEAIGSLDSERISSSAKELKNNILHAVEKSIAEAPVVPIGDGLWCPSISPWPEHIGPLALYTDKGECYTHGSLMTRDTLIGAIYLLFLNVVDKKSVMADFILNSFSALFYERHTAFSQPYYSPHPLLNHMRGERKAFLMEFYNGLSALADRETYSFWEHFYQLSPHKVHEEAWFLMRCRYLLYMEELNNSGNTLNILPGAPTEWLLSGQDIKVSGANTYFGKLWYAITHKTTLYEIHAAVKLEEGTLPCHTLVIHIPLSENMRLKTVSTGIIKANTIIIDNFKDEVEVQITTVI